MMVCAVCKQPSTEHVICPKCNKAIVTRQKEFESFMQILGNKMLEIGKRCGAQGYDVGVNEVFILAIEELKIGKRP